MAWNLILSSLLLGELSVPSPVHIPVESHRHPPSRPLVIRQKRCVGDIHRSVRLSFRSLSSCPVTDGSTNSGQRGVTVSTNEPVYIAFSTTESMYTWLTLLRSYAVPEVYGTMIKPSEGGLYRMWRQVEVHCISARDLGQTKHLSDSKPSEAGTPLPATSDLPFSSNGSDSNGSWPSGTSDGGGDYDVWCEIWVNSMLCARTTVKRCTLTPEWHESFLISDLPPYDNLQIILHKEKRGSLRSVTIGSVVVPLGTFQRGEYMEGWNPIVGANTTVSTGSGFYTQIGEMRLKLKVDE